MESDKKKSKEKPAHPRATANPLSALTFSWTIPVFLRGRKRELEVEDLFAPLEEHKSSLLGDKFESAWNKEVERCKKKNKEPSFTRVIYKVFGCQILALGVLIFISEIIIRIAQPLLLGGLIDYFTSGHTRGEEQLKEAYMYAGGVALCSAISVFLAHPFMMGIMHIGMKIRVAACSLIYRKALKLSKTALGQTTVGQLVNLLSNDVNRFDIAFIFLHNLWIGPLQTFIVTYFVWELIGPASIVGLLSLLLFIPLQAWLGKKVSMLRLKTAIRTDERVRLMNEIISGIQVIKMYTWEKPFAFLVSEARRKEINLITKSSYCKGIMLSFLMFHSRTSIFLSLLGYVLFGKAVITAQTFFVVTCFYNSLRQTMTIFFPFGTAYIAETFISIKRIQEFLLSEELEIKYNTKPQIPIIHVGEGEVTEPIICIDNATAKWMGDQVDNTLTNINMKILPGKITSVIGPVASGKSSLLHVMLKELPLSSGTVRVNGTLSYASQEPWLFIGSIRQNILFGQDFDRDRYRQVVKVCALATDFEQLPHGDQTLIGERGVSLSGGQRARVSLARAIYKKADIYLLDDPLSAVDAHVGKHLFEDCISAFLRGKTVLLITHQLHYLNYVDRIILVENGQVTAEGKFSELLNKGLDFTNFLTGEENEETQGVPRKISVHSIASSLDVVEKNVEIAEDETMCTGRVRKGVYLSYLKAGGGFFMVSSVMLFFIFAQAFATGADYWLAYWVNFEQYGSSPIRIVNNRYTCIYVFAGLIIGTIVLTLCRSFMFFSTCMKASKILHDNMFNCITRATIRFFHTNSSGRILNRFSSDMGTIDELLPSSFADILQVTTALVGLIAIVVTVNPWLMIPTFVSAMIFYYLRTVYLMTSRSIKRLEGVTRSPIFTHLTATLQGITTIRAYKAQEVLKREFDNHQDLHSTVWYLYLATYRGFAFWLDFLCLIYVAFVTFNFLIIIPGSYSGGVGLAITQAIGLLGQFQWAMRVSAELESEMTSVERVLEYAQLYSEPPIESLPGKKPRDSWPEKGEIEFVEVSLRYSRHDTWVLKDISFVIHPQQKVGVVGRTGAGKSSIIAALFRLTEIEGQIILDGIETKSIGLHDLRSKISIIPQEPVLFSGSLRKNLDPFDQFSDDILWSALEQVELKESVGELAGGLSAKMAEGGANFSVGQRQLVCLARAIVRNNRVLVLDEATANVDPKTDALIQNTLRKNFSHCTVITIAHRLMTIMDSDKILVIDDGILMECDHPHLLLENKNSFLTRLVKQTNKSNEELLKKMALQSYQKQLGA